MTNTRSFGIASGWPVAQPRRAGYIEPGNSALPVIEGKHLRLGYSLHFSRRGINLEVNTKQI